MQRTATAERFTWPVGFLLTVICCFLLMTPASQVIKKADMDASVRLTAMTLAVTGLSNPVSSISQFLNNERSPFRTAGKRTHGYSVESEKGESCVLASSRAEIPMPLLSVTPFFPISFLSPPAFETLPWHAMAPPASLPS